jgi:hypothetical protein
MKSSVKSKVKLDRPRIDHGSKASGYVYSEEYPFSVDIIASSLLREVSTSQVLSRFLLRTPCPGLSTQHIPLQHYGWNNPWGKPEYLNRKLKDASSNLALLFSAAGNNDMKQALSKACLLEKFGSCHDEEAIAFSDNKKNQFLSVFGHIRNAIAHGRFTISDTDAGRKYLFEDIAQKNKHGHPISARMVLRESTLLSWIEIIELGPHRDTIDLSRAIKENR